MDVQKVRADFPILSRTINGHPLVYLDSGATSQRPNQVIDAEADFYRHHNANAHRGLYQLGEETTELFEGARAKLASFIGAPAPETVVFTRGTTESMNLVAHGWGRTFLREGDEILITEMEHHSNIVPWQMTARATGAVLRYIPLTDDGMLDLSDLSSLLTERTKLLSVTGMSNALGTITPLGQLIEAAHAGGGARRGGRGAAGAAPPRRRRRARLRLPRHQRSQDAGAHCVGRPVREGRASRGDGAHVRGGEMIREVFHDHATWNDVPYKFEAGTMQIGQQIGLGAAIDYLEALGMDEVRAHEEDITRYALDRLIDCGATVFGPKDIADRGGAVSFWYKEVHPHDLATILNEHGVAIRAGHHCAQLVMRRYGVPATARASFYVVQHQGGGRRVDRRAGRRPGHLRLTLGGNVALDDIYKEVILDHYKSPRNKRELPGAELKVHGRTTRSAATRSPCSRTSTTARSPRSPSRAPAVRSASPSASMMTEAVGGVSDRRRPPSGRGVPRHDGRRCRTRRAGVRRPGGPEGRREVSDPHQVRRAGLGLCCRTPSRAPAPPLGHSPTASEPLSMPRPPGMRLR
jgi:cysteine desulfurase/selenocysteine lyase